MDQDDLINYVACIAAIVTIFYTQFFFDDDEGVGRRAYPLEKVFGYAEETVPRLTPNQFREHFRLTTGTFEHLLENLALHLRDSNLPYAAYKICVEPAKQLMIALWVVANREAFRSVGDRFGVAKSTAWFCLRKVVCALLVLNREKGIIRWPSGARLMEIIAAFYRGDTGLPGVVASIDGSHMPIPAPLLYHNAYVNRKGFHSILLQGACDPDMLFLDCYAGEVGSIHDQAMFRRSGLYKRISNGTIVLHPDHHLIGDSAYTLTQYMMVPYKDNGHLTREQINFNVRLSSIRNVIERAFALLKNRFRRLKYLEMSRVEMIPQVIMACCILHNVCILQDDWEWLDYDGEDFDGNDNNDEFAADPNHPRRVDPLDANAQRISGRDKRTNLTNSLRILRNLP